MTFFSWAHQEQYQKLFACLPDPAGMRFVGGVVRNSLLGIAWDDVDFATLYHPEEITCFFKSHGYKVIPTGIDHGTVTVLCDGHSYEITTLRRDIETDGRHAVVAYTSQWEDDAQRRDFTMNALYVDHCGCLYDYVGGQKDIENQVIRFIGDPAQRIREDYLRIVRFFRFWALYGHTPDADSLEKCVALKHNLNQLSSERITKEMIKLLGARNPWPVVRCLYAYGFDSLLWGHSGQMSGISGLERVEKMWGPAPLWVRFAFLSGVMPRRLTLSNDQKKHLNALWSPLFSNQDTMALLQKKSSHNGKDLWLAALSSVYQYGMPWTKDRLWMVALTHMGSGDVRSENTTGNDFAEKGDLKGLHVCKNIMDALDCLDFPNFSLSGRDVMAFGVSGPDIGRVLNQTKAWWIGCEMRPSHEECVLYGKTLVGVPAEKELGQVQSCRTDHGGMISKIIEKN
jgi:poly(A) polymerase